MKSGATYTGVFSAAISDKGQLAVVLKVAHVRQKGTPADEPPTVRPQPVVTLPAKDIVQARGVWPTCLFSRPSMVDP